MIAAEHIASITKHVPFPFRSANRGCKTWAHRVSKSVKHSTTDAN